MQRTFDNNDIRRQVLEFLAKLGIEPYDEDDIVINGELHRFRTREDKSGEKSGAIVIYTDGWPAGYVQDWRNGIKEYWKYETSGLDEEQRTYFNSEAFRKKCEEDERKTKEKRERKQRDCCDAAGRLWEHLPEAPKNHPYLVRKNLMWLNGYNLRYQPDKKGYAYPKCLAVPLKDKFGRVRSIQWIPEEGHKSFAAGTSLEGLFWECWLDEAMERDPRGIILLGEGFATMVKIFELTSKPVVAAMSCYRLEAVARILREKYSEAKIIITADNDHQTQQKRGNNPGLDHAVELKKIMFHGKPLADEVIYPEFKPDEDGSDWDDYANIHGNDFARAKLNEDIARALMPANIREMLDKDRLRMVGAQNLRYKEFEPIKWAVPGLLPSGLSILGAPPKTGKSILALQIALGVSIGGYVLGKIKVEQGDVLYLALEDNERRLQERISSSNNIDENDDLSHLTLAYTVPRQDDGGLEFIEWWLQEHPNARLVIIDTLQKFRKQLSNKANVYAEDYDIISDIKRLADNYDVAFLLLHHLKKVSPKNEINMDWIDLFSGSAGIVGSADTLFIIKRARESVNGKLFRTGRDVEEKEFWLTLDGFGWCLDSDAEYFTLPEGERKILEYLKGHEKGSPIDMSDALNMNINTLKTNLTKLVKKGLLVKVGYGTYSLKKEDNECGQNFT